MLCIINIHPNVRDHPSADFLAVVVGKDARRSIQHLEPTMEGLFVVRTFSSKISSEEAALVIGRSTREHNVNVVNNHRLRLQSDSF